ncbi:hypothetical protein [Parvularcula dongshanensis]|uniref:Uncharacterized protein n=1 Tax=Parvularcula dongshanensis TaxID=1173995 RepID=A0A840I4E2_9PROT|nr:hypothetical protein [Parvularcula dongshanensis]MBB4659133.1 hypothetical protein [Parvularcula dongshanensis]
MGKVIAAIVVIAILIFGWMYFTDTDVEGGSLPDVDVEGGSMPDVDVRGPEVTTGTETVEVPTIGIDVPEDDADGEEDEIVDDEGLNAPDVDVDVDADVERNPD